MNLYNNFKFNTKKMLKKLIKNEKKFIKILINFLNKNNKILFMFQKLMIFVIGKLIQEKIILKQWLK